MILDILQQLPFFAELDAKSHEAIIDRIRMHFYPAGYCIFSEGDAAEGMFLIKSGKVKVFHPHGEYEDEVDVLGPGAFFGEMALISNAPRNASVKAVDDCELFTLSKKELEALMVESPLIAQSISQAVIKRTEANSPDA